MSAPGPSDDGEALSRFRTRYLELAPFREDREAAEGIVGEAGSVIDALLVGFAAAGADLEDPAHGEGLAMSTLLGRRAGELGVTPTAVLAAWTDVPSNPVIAGAAGPSEPSVLQDDADFTAKGDAVPWKVWYVRGDGATSTIGYATSMDGDSWTERSADLGLPAGLASPHVLYDAAQFGEGAAEMRALADTLGEIPLVGFFASGEIYQSRIYAYTGVLTLFL